MHTSDFGLIQRSLNDVIVEPYRSQLIPNYFEVKTETLKAGALGAGISGSGPSIFSLSKGLETANNVADAMKKAYNKTGIDFDIHVSQINKEGVKVL